MHYYMCQYVYAPCVCMRVKKREQDRERVFFFLATPEMAKLCLIFVCFSFSGQKMMKEDKKNKKKEWRNQSSRNKQSQRYGRKALCVVMVKCVCKRVGVQRVGGREWKAFCDTAYQHTHAHIVSSMFLQHVPSNQKTHLSHAPKQSTME